VAKVQVRSRGADLVVRRLLRAAAKADDVRPAEPAVARRVAAGYGRSFDRQGPGWSSLKGSTVRRRLAEGYSSGPILDKTGAYRSAATSASKLIIHADRDGFTISVRDKKAGFHQTGTKNMRSRRLELSPGDASWLARDIADHVHS
jgi:hypothetical protein